ncbi:MAG: DUF4430 domain-containing protein, partial [Solirubrobacterales bacterium]
ALIAAALALAGCGASAPASGDHGELVVTRDFGAKSVAGTRTTPVTAGLTAMRQLQSSAKTETAYGGKFVTSINGFKQDISGGLDWLFYVDGIEAEIGAASTRLRAGQIVQWDYHRWRDVETGGAIVGAFPRPLSSRGVSLECLPAASVACDTVRTMLKRAAVELEKPTSKHAVRMFVGRWAEISTADGVPGLGERGAENGAFAQFSGKAGAGGLALFGDDGKIARTLGRGAGLVAAFNKGDTVTWVVTGVDERGAVEAARTLGSGVLAGRFAVAVTVDGVVGLPISVERRS